MCGVMETPQRREMKIPLYALMRETHRGATRGVCHIHIRYNTVDRYNDREIAIAQNLGNCAISHKLYFG